MPLDLHKPITYLITSGETTAATTPSTEDFSRILKLVSAAVAAGVNLIQLREKNLTARVLFELALQSAEITHGSATRLLINDRADIARGARADGVHLQRRSLEPHIVRRTFGEGFLIGVSTHSLAEARAARDGGADFVVFGPVFDTVSKRIYGEPVGLEKLSETARELAPFPIIALGGVTLDNAQECLRAGARGVAAIRLFNDPARLSQIVETLLSERGT
jgi:thiamine-phosphate pyrophosphorylase